MDKKIRVLIAKTSLDGHWRGVVTVAAAFRDAGMVLFPFLLRAKPQSQPSIAKLTVTGSRP